MPVVHDHLLQSYIANLPKKTNRASDLGSISRIMEWLHKLRRALLTFSARLKLRKSLGSGRAGGDQFGGLRKLEDDVQTCEYQDVQIMWNMLSKVQQEDIQIIAKSQPPTNGNHKNRRQLRPAWSFFGPGTQSCVLVRLESDDCSMLR